VRACLGQRFGNRRAVDAVSAGDQRDASDKSMSLRTSKALPSILDCSLNAGLHLGGFSKGAAPEADVSPRFCIGQLNGSSAMVYARP
jgi:hypothetical protein